MSHIRITLPDQVGSRSRKVELDGLDITKDLKGVRLSVHADDDVTRLELELNLPTADVTADATVSISEHTRQLLINLGWTPPA